MLFTRKKKIEKLFILLHNVTEKKRILYFIPEIVKYFIFFDYLFVCLNAREIFQFDRVNHQITRYLLNYQTLKVETDEHFFSDIILN